jgi:hypothetical protein
MASISPKISKGPNAKDNFQPIGLNAFFGGQAIDKKLGTPGQFYDDYHSDFRSNPSYISANPQPRDITQGTVKDLQLAMEQINSGQIFSVGDQGYIYAVSTTDVFSLVGTLDEVSGAGLTYRADVDNMYLTGQTKVARMFHMSGVQTLDKNWFTHGISNSSTCFKTGGTNTYTVPLAINENASNKRAFTSDIDPLYQLGVKVISKGTGDWTLTLHDDANNVLGTVIITNANLKNNTINYFVFSSPIRIQRGNNGAGSALTYHFHLTSTVADGTIATITQSSMVDCDMELWANALVTTRNGSHPTANFLNFTLIGNGNYLATYEPLQDSPTTADFNRHALTFPPGYEVCGFAQKNLMIVIGCEKRSTSGDFQDGALFFWDGTSETFNDWWPAPEGSPESLFSWLNTVYYVSNGVLTQVQSTDQPLKIRTLRNTNTTFSGVQDSTHVYPNMMTVHRGVLHLGYPSQTSNQNLQHGIYTYGVISREYPLSFGYGYTPSPGHQLNDGSNNLRVGTIKSFGDRLFMSWRDDEATPYKYGVDIVDNNSTPANNFGIVNLRFDDERPYAYKNAGSVIATFDRLPAGVTITLKYKTDTDTDWHYSTETATAGDEFLVFAVDARFLWVDYGMDIICGATSPNISSLFIWVDPLLNERSVGN